MSSAHTSAAIARPRRTSCVQQSVLNILLRILHPLTIIIVTNLKSHYCSRMKLIKLHSYLNNHYGRQRLSGTSQPASTSDRPEGGVKVHPNEWNPFEKTLHANYVINAAFIGTCSEWVCVASSINPQQLPRAS